MNFAPRSIQGCARFLLSVLLLWCGAMTGASASTAGLTLYSIGQPTDDEQHFIELINRARANPTQEALRFANTTDRDVLYDYTYWEVDLALMVAQFQQIPARPPLAINANLTAAARRHSLDMRTTKVQSHIGSDGTSFGQRAIQEGYTSASVVKENVFISSLSTWHGHAAFEVDWGIAPGGGSIGGMQNPPGHRENIHSSEAREVGVGVAYADAVSGIGPQVVTQVLGSRHGLSPFVTGVVYHDLNGNGFYDAGEGIGGVTVTVTGSQFYAVTASSGGYSIPVPGNGAYTVNFAGPGLAQSVSRTVAGSANVKADLVVPHALTVSGPATAPVGAPIFLLAGESPLQEGVRWRRTRRINYTYVEGAEAGLTHVVAETTPGYNPIQSAVKAAGNWAFQLVHPEPEPQILTLKRKVAANASTQLTFRTRMRWADEEQQARAEVSADGGATWTTVWSQNGSNSSGEGSFTTRTVPLGAYAGKEVAVRFVYEVLGGYYFNLVDSTMGFFVDEIGFTDGWELVDEVITNGGTDRILQTTVPTAAIYRFQAAVQTGGRTRTYGAPLDLTAVATTVAPSILRHPSGVTVELGQPIVLDVIANGSNLTYQWFRNDQPLGGQTARVLTIASATADSGGTYRVQINGSLPSNTATVTVNIPPPTGFAAWKQERFSPGDAGNPSVSGPLVDPHGRGVPNLLRYAFALPADWKGGAGLPVSEWSGTPTNAAIRFRRLKSRPDLVYQVESSSDLSTWTPADVALETVSDHGDHEWVRARLNGTAGARAFLRVKVVLD